jgi:hypothetical protein
MNPIMRMRSLALIVGTGLAATACKDSTSVTDLNNVSAEALAAGLTPASVQLLVTGLLNTSRGEVDSRYLVFMESMARDFYRLDNAENRYVNELIGPFPADFSAFTGGGAFTNFYVTIRSANTILNNLGNVQGLSDAEISATRGVARTMVALSLYRALETRDSLGIAVDVNHPIDDPPAPFVCKPNALATISAILDSAATDLAAGGAAFPYKLPGGFRLNGEFDTPPAFLTFNRGIKGKVELYRALSREKPTGTAGFNAAIAAINASFADPTADMNLGVYYTFSTAAGELTNPLADANLYLNPFVGDSIQPGDARVSKIINVASKTLNGVTSAYKSTVTDPKGLSNPIALLKNSELLLVRAQAKVGLGDLAGATADVNAVRVADGGLAALPTFTSATQAINAILYEKRYSLLGESAQRLVDLRAYGYLTPTGVATYGAVAGGPGGPGDLFQTALPIPKTQLDTRGVTSITPDCP